MLVDSIFKTLEAGIVLLAEREKNYTDKHANKLEERRQKLQKDFYEEDNKPEGNRDLAKLDVIRFELRELCDDFNTTVAK